MSCDVGEVTEGLENELWCRWGDGKVGEWVELIVIVIAELILQPIRHFTYVTAHSTALQFLHLRHRHFTHITAHSPTLPPLYLHHSSLYNPSIASPTSKVIVQPLRCFTYVTSTSRTYLASRPCIGRGEKTVCGGLACYSKLLNLEVATILDSC